MDAQKKRIAVQGLRRADADTLLVLTQDVLRATIGRVEPATLCDLLALSELDTGLNVALHRDLKAFQLQMFREMEDLPDSSVLADYARELAAVDPKRVPTCLREAVARLAPERKHLDAVAALAELAARWEGTTPDKVVLTVRLAPGTRAVKPRPEIAPKPVRERLPPAHPPVQRVRTPAAQVDERRVTWVEEEVLNRLEPYGVNGLKEAVLVAGARHRSPYKDLAEDEILAVLRRLKRENRVRNVGNRWMSASSR